MKTRFWVLMSLLLLASCKGHAATVTGRLEDGRMHWLSGRGNGEYLLSNAFDRPSGLPLTLKWVPGTFAMSAKRLTLTSETGELVTVDAQLVGATYLAAPGFSPEAAPAAAPYCREREEVLATQTRVLNSDGDFCIASKMGVYSTPTKPFQQYQPILKLTLDELVDKLKDKPTGTYTGVISGTLRYGFYVTASSALSYRNIPVSFTVQIRNVASHLSSLTVLGNGHISPKYNTYKHTAGGGAGYKITARGDFETGIRFRFIGKPDDDYTLKPVGHPLAATIPYSVDCSGCLPDTKLVDSGALLYPEQWSRVEQSGNSVTFDLRITYRDVQAEDIVDKARYQDSFTLMLEAIL